MNDLDRVFVLLLGPAREAMDDSKTHYHLPPIGWRDDARHTT
jgi:hypothetical protein